MSSSLSIQRIIKLFWSISKELRTTKNSAGNLRGRPFSTLLLMIPLSQNGYGSRLRDVGAYFLCDPPYTRSRCSGFQLCWIPAVSVLRYGVELAVADKSDEAVYVGSGGEITKLTNIRAAEAGHLHAASVENRKDSQLPLSIT
ncbi:uncharacterized protein LOC106366021 [Brassica napus]|uniref:uncharacterized protein LOC106366021 n=1 Tax=Brassica napus TaxID=3708 RepID=UPI0006AB31D8|nr:uncharacterized protein LOC106366021 [Brassica napus]